MTQRDVPTSVVESLNRTASPHALLAFLTITHPNLAATVRVVSDHFDYVVGANTFLGVPFTAQPMTDGENAPFAQLVMQNVKATVSRALETAQSRAIVALTIYSSADFDLTQVPRQTLVTPAKVYGYERFELTQIEVTPATITARISLPDYARESWPSIAATEDKFPGLFI